MYNLLSENFRNSYVFCLYKLFFMFSFHSVHVTAHEVSVSDFPN